MAAWSRDELDRIGEADELEITTLRADGTPRKPVTIWVVRHGDALYVRAGAGRASAWFRNVQARRDGRIQSAGVDKEVFFEDAQADTTVNDGVDAAFRGKYGHHGEEWIAMLVSPLGRSTTTRLVPR
jgi:hypothetical protein